MDSSSVLACATEISKHKQHAFSSVYTDKTFDESDAIGGFVEEKVARWHPVPIEGFDLFDVAGRMVRAHDEPVATATWLSHFLLCNEVAEAGVDVLFGGLGGDELNAGESSSFCHFADLKRRAATPTSNMRLPSGRAIHDHPIYRKNRNVAQAMLRSLTDPNVPGRVRIDQRRFGRYSAALRRDFRPRRLHAAIDHPFASWLKNRAYQDIFRETAPCCLRAEDRNCAAFGLRHADPFFDHRLIEFMFRVPGSFKIRDGIAPSDCCAKQCGGFCRKRPAPGSPRPDGTPRRTSGSAPARSDRLLDLVHSRAFRERGISNVAEVTRLIAEHRDIVASGEPRENHMMFIWQLLNVELWYQNVVDHRPPAAGERVAAQGA